MGHNLAIRDGKASMMYVGEVPWHGLGTQLDNPATAAEAIRAAHLEWRVGKKPLYIIDESNREYRIPGYYAVAREDMLELNCEPPQQPVLGIVADGYTPLQNIEAFQFFDQIVGQGAAVYHTAGALGNGEKVWILAKLPSQIRVIGDDVLDKYLLLANSHDGSTSVQIKFTPIRVVCQNTLTMALSEGGKLIRVQHTRDMHRKLQAVTDALRHIQETFKDLETSFERMTRVQMPEDRLRGYLRDVFPDPSDPKDEKTKARVARDRSLAEHFYVEGAGNRMSGVRGTLWAAYNGVTELVDHRQLTGTSNDSRLSSIWFGQGYLTKARAYRVARDLAEVTLN